MMVQITTDEVVQKMEQMYPEQLGRVVAEIRAEKAEQRVAELEEHVHGLEETGADRDKGSEGTLRAVDEAAAQVAESKEEQEAQ